MPFQVKALLISGIFFILSTFIIRLVEVEEIGIIPALIITTIFFASLLNIIIWLIVSIILY